MRGVGEEEEKKERKEKAGKEREDASGKVIEVKELWKVHGKESTAFFAQVFSSKTMPVEPSAPGGETAWPTLSGASSSGTPTKILPPSQSSSSPSTTSPPHVQPHQDYFTGPELKSLLDNYITSHSLVHPRDRQYVVLDTALKAVLAPPKNASKKKKQGEADGEALASGTNGSGDTDVYLARDELLPKLKGAMQAWYEVSKGGKLAVRKSVHTLPLIIIPGFLIMEGLEHSNSPFIF